MSDPTQAPPAGDPPGAPAPATDAAADRVFEAADIQRGLWLWLGVVTAGGVLAALLGHAEGAILFAAAGAFALAQASDAAATLEGYRRFVDDEMPSDRLHGRLLRFLAGALVPIAGALFYAAFGAYAWSGAGEKPLVFVAWWCFGAALVSLSLASRRVADLVTWALFRGATGRTRRLTARLTVLALMLPLAAVPVMPGLLAQLKQSGGALADAPGLAAQLLAEIAVAFAGVGLFVRRDWSAVRERLGLQAMRPAHAVLALAGLVAAVVLNGGSGWIEQHVFPALFAHDEDVTRMIAARLPFVTSLLLGTSAGVGEELMMRGALQPRLGIPLCSLLFASAHVQYSWFGMLTVGLLGVLLGVIRARSNTTTAIVVHALYDIYAAVTTH